MAAQLEKEYSTELIDFWRAARQYALLLEGERAAAARQVVEEHIVAGSPKEMNISASAREEVERDYASGGGDDDGAPSATLFDGAVAEVFSLMERDTFRRLQQDPKLGSELAAAFFANVDADGDGTIRYHEYRRWALAHPEVLAFFGALQQSVRTAVLHEAA